MDFVDLLGVAGAERLNFFCLPPVARELRAYSIIIQLGCFCSSDTLLLCQITPTLHTTFTSAPRPHEATTLRPRCGHFPSVYPHHRKRLPKKPQRHQRTSWRGNSSVQFSRPTLLPPCKQIPSFSATSSPGSPSSCKFYLSPGTYLS